MSAGNIARQWTSFYIDSGHVVDLAVGKSLNFVPIVDDQGILVTGNGTKDMDVKHFLGGAGAYVEFNSGDSQLVLSGVAIVGGGALVTEATAARTITSADYGKTINLTGGAGITTVTLDAPSASNVGVEITIVSLSNHAHVLALANKIIAPNTVTSDSVTAADTNKTGQVVTVRSDGSKWVVVSWTGTWTVAA